MSNIQVTYKKGALGKVIEFNDLRDFTGLVTLTPYTITLNIQDADGELLIDDAAVSQRDQVTRPGDCYIALNSSLANLSAGTYNAELKLVQGSNVDYWPTERDGRRQYITWLVQEPLG